MKIVSVPFSGGSLGKNSDCNLAPEIILENMEYNVADVDNLDIEKTNKILEEIKGELFIGGDHSITYSLFKGFAKNNENPVLIVFDAHPDCVNNFSPPTHEDFLKVLIEENVLKKQNVFLIGLRKIDEIEQDFLDKNKIRYLLMSDITNMEDLIDEVNKFISGFGNIYLSLDIDVLDPLEAPGTGYLEENGMKLDDLKFILSNILSNKIKRIDLVEVNPALDKDNKTVNSAKEILNLMISKLSQHI